MLSVGLTGGIASGKSQVAACLARAGFRTLDLDQVGHTVIAPGGAAHADVVSAFGRRILKPDGEVDRKALAGIVFADASARARLNAIVHPRIRAEESTVLASLGPDAALVVEAALIVETGQHLRFDRLLVAHCEPAEQRRRLRERDRLDEAAVERRLAAQMPAEEKRRFAHFEIDTSGPIAETRAAVERLVAPLWALADRGQRRVELGLEQAAGLVLGGGGGGPRGLSPALLLGEIAHSGSLEMETLLARLSPPAAGPWYEAGAKAQHPGAEALVAPLVLWSLLRAGDDLDFTAAAAASLARLVHEEEARRTRTILAALLLQEAVMNPRLATASARARGLAERWGGSPVDDGSLRADFDRALRLLVPMEPDADTRRTLEALRASTRPPA